MNWESRCALLHLLPRDVLEMVTGKLDVKASRRLASTCRLLYALSREAVPGLRLSLHPHQVCPCRRVTFAYNFLW